MAGQTSDAERTEEATPRRRAEARDRGHIPKSAELTVAVSLLASAVALSAMTPLVGTRLFDLMGHGLATIGAVQLDNESAVLLLRDTALRACTAVVGLIVAMTGATFAVAALQARGVLSVDPITPRLSRINPATNARTVFGTRSLVELLKAFAKLAIVGAAVYGSMKMVLPDAIALSQESQLGFLYVVKRYSVRMLGTAGAAYLALAAVDYAWQCWQYERSLRMTRQELKQEVRENEGDPHLKQRRRSIARHNGRAHTMTGVRTADVVIVDGTRRAVAIRYDSTDAPAPVVLTAVTNAMAARVVEIARAADIPIIDRAALARSLAETATVGSMIPVELHGPVAEVLASVMRMRNRMATAGVDGRQ